MQRDVGGVRARILGTLLTLLCGVIGAAPAAEPLDFILRQSSDPDLLSERQAVLRHRLLQYGVDPMRGGRPTLTTLLERRFAEKVRWDLLAESRQVELIEVDWRSGLVKVIRFPETTLFATAVDTNLVGIAFQPARDFSDSTVTIEVHGVDAWRRHWVAVGLESAWRSSLLAVQTEEAAGSRALNFRIPVKIPRSLERIIGRGDATNIRISGQESITIGGESTLRNDFVANEIQQRQSRFPSLEMEQRLRVDLSGSVGEKIQVKVTHNSDVGIGQKSTEVKLEFVGDEDDIIRGIRAGDIDVTLPGSGLIGVAATRGGLFGLRVEGAMGPVAFTLFTSKEQSQSNSRSFSASGGTPTPFSIPSTDYIRNRFFRLFAPDSRYFDATTPNLVEVVTDESALANAGITLDINTLELYVSVAAGLQGENIFGFGRAYVDSVGNGWEDANGNFDRSLPTENLSEKSDLWRRLEFETDWFPLLVDERPVGIALRTPLQRSEALAATFDLVDASGQLVRRVGRRLLDSTRPDSTRIFHPIDGKDGHFFKLIKPINPSDPEQYVQNGRSELAISWEYMLRNFYDLRGTQIEPGKIELRIEVRGGSGEGDDLMPQTSPTDTRYEWIRVFGLDQQQVGGAAGADGQPDYDDPIRFLLNLGVLQFPDSTPFYTTPAEIAANLALRLGEDPENPLSQAQLDTIETLAGSARQVIYRKDLIPNSQDIQDQTKFDIVGEHTSTSSRLNLNAFNIKEGSESVTLNGRPLTRGTDYTIDYFSGEITLTGAAAELTAQSNIGVNFEVDPLFGGGRTSLHGVHLGYELGAQKTLSTTWLLQSEPTTARKPRLGEEPNRTYVGNLAAKLRFAPYFLTRMANWLPTVDSDQNSTVNLDAEVAMSVPNPNTLGRAYLDDFESADESITIGMSREGWAWSSLPAEPDTVSPGQRRFAAADRAFTRWFKQTPSATRAELNPDLSEQERRDVVQALAMRMIGSDAETDPTLRRWQSGEFGGIMRGFPGDVDLSRAQFLEFWVNDFTGNDMALREGKLHFDFGSINEDFWWRSGSSTTDTLGVYDTEDGETTDEGQTPPNGILDGQEDTGLDRLFNEAEGTSAFTVRPGREPDLAGDNSAAATEFLDPNDPRRSTHPYLANEQFLFINGTEENRRLDKEDLDLDAIFNRSDGYFSLELELSNSEDAIVDIYRDYANNAGFIGESLSKRNAWRRYRLDLRKLKLVQPPLGDGTPYDRTTPDLSRISHFRIWYENPDGVINNANPVIVFAEMRFLGNRWLADGLRDSTQVVIPPANRLPDQDFRIGVVNNKENPDYLPPVFPDTRNNIAEKEQSLQLVYSGLREGEEIRVRKENPGGQRIDLLIYAEQSFFWRAPYDDGLRDSAQDRLEAFYWVGTDSTNYYEISFPFGEVRYTRGDWHEVRVDFGELSNLRLNPAQTDTLPNGAEVIRGSVRDTQTGDLYGVVIRGRPDLRRVANFYAGIRYPEDPGASLPSFSGDVLFNELRLAGAARDVGYAERFATNVNIPGFGDLSGEFRQTDEEFHGLNEKRGSNILRRNWSLRASSALQNLLPTFGLEIPVSGQLREELQLPRYRTNSDIELIDDAQRQEEKTESSSNQYTIQLRKTKPSRWRLLQYSLDRFNYSRSEAFSTTESPLNRTERVSVDQRFGYDVRLARGYEVVVPWVSWKLRYLPTQFSLGSDWSFDRTTDERKVAGAPPQVPQTTKTLNNRLQLTQNFAENLRTNFTIASNRNRRIRFEGDGVTEDPGVRFLGLDIGHEEVFNQSLNLTYNPLLPVLRWFSPEIGYNTNYRENRAPGVRQRAGESSAYLGEAGVVRNAGNSGGLNVRATVDFVGWIKKRWGAKPGSTTPAPPRPAEDRQEAGPNARGRRAQSVPGTLEPEEQSQSSTAPDSTGLPIPPLPLPGLQAPDTTTVPTPQGQLPQEASPQPPTPQGSEPAQPERAFRPGAAGKSLLRPFTNLFSNLKPLSISYDRNRTSSFYHVSERANLLYRFGLVVDDDEDAAGFDAIIPGTSQRFSNKDRHLDSALNLSTQSQLSNDVRLDASYRTSASQDRGSVRQATESSRSELGSGINVARVQEWALFRSWLTTSGIQFNFRRTRSLTGTIGASQFPQFSHSYNPRWNGTFNNGMSTSLNLQYATDTQESNVSDSRRHSFSVNLDLEHRFDAEGRLRFLRFGRQGVGNTIDMTINSSFRQDAAELTQKGSGTTAPQRSGSRTWAFEPRFQYQFSQNVRGGLLLRYTRRTDLGRTIRTQEGNEERPKSESYGIFFDATLTF